MIRKLYLIITYSFMLISALLGIYLALPPHIQEQIPLITRFMAITGSVSFGTFTGMLLWVYNLISKLNKDNVIKHADNKEYLNQLEKQHNDKTNQLETKLISIINLLTLLVESKADNPFTKSDIKDKIKEVLSDE